MKQVFRKMAALVLALGSVACLTPAAPAGQVYYDRSYRDVQTFNNTWATMVTVGPGASTTSTGQVQVVTRVWYYGSNGPNYYRVKLEPYIYNGSSMYGPTHTLNTTVDYWYNDTMSAWANKQLAVSLQAYTSNQYTWSTTYNTIKNNAFDIYYN